MKSNEKMKVLLCSPKNGTGGIASWTNHILNYYSNLDQPDINLRLLSMDRKIYVKEGERSSRRLYYGFVEYSEIIKNICNETKANHYNMVHLVSSASLSLLKDIVILRKMKRRKIETAVHFRFGRIPKLFQHPNWETRLLKKVIKLTKRVIVIDEASYNTLKQQGYNNIYYLPNPVSTAIQPIIDNNPDIERKPRTLLFAGHVIKTKGVFELIEACKQIPDIKLKMIGLVNPDVKKLIDEQVKPDAESWLSMPGNLPFEDVIKEMLSCSVFVLPTYTEGFPNVILESMACGCSIVTTPVGAIPEMLDIHGEEQCGVCVEVKDVDGLRDAIQEMLDNPEYAASMGAKAQKRVNEMYAMPVVWKRLVEIWK